MKAEGKSKEWLDKVGPIVVAEAAKRGYAFPGAIIAQAHVESWKGKYKTGKPSTLAGTYFNLFGMKTGSSWSGRFVEMKTKEEYRQGVLTPIYAKFRAYNSLEEGIAGYFDFIHCGRYNNLKNATSVDDYFEKIKNDGWATSYSYVETLKKRYKDLGLDDLNFGAITGYGFTVGDNYTTTVDLYIRETPNGAKKSFFDITNNAKMHSNMDDDCKAILKVGTIVTVLEIKKLITSVWVRIPSGWICAKSSLGKIYIV